MTEDEIKLALECVETLLRSGKATVSVQNSIRVTSPKNAEYMTYAYGAGRRVRVEIPCEAGDFYQQAEL